MNLEDETRFLQKVWTIERRPLTDAEIETLFQLVKELSYFEQNELIKRFGLNVRRVFSGSRKAFAEKFRQEISLENEKRKQWTTKR